MSKWTTYSYDLLYTVPRLPGVYAIYKDNLLEYIGSSTNVRHRLRDHPYLPSLKHTWQRHTRRSPEPHPEYTIKVRTDFRAGEWLMLEYRLIKRLGPLMNMQHAKRLGTPLAKNVFTFRESNKRKAYTATVEAVKMARELSSKGLTRIELCRQLNSEGYRDSAGRRWTEPSVNKLVNNLGSLYEPEVIARNSSNSNIESIS